MLFSNLLFISNVLIISVYADDIDELTNLSWQVNSECEKAFRCVFHFSQY